MNEVKIVPKNIIDFGLRPATKNPSLKKEKLILDFFVYFFNFIFEFKVSYAR